MSWLAYRDQADLLIGLASLFAYLESGILELSTLLGGAAITLSTA